MTITDADLGLVEQVCLLEGITTDGSPMLRLKLLLIEEMSRDSRLTA